MSASDSYCILTTLRNIDTIHELADSCYAAVPRTRNGEPEAETEPHRSAAYPWLRSNDKGQPCPERSSSATAGLVRMQLLARAAAGGHCRLNHGLFGKYSYPFPNGPSRYDSGHVRAWPCFESSCPLVGPGLRGGWDSAQCEGHDRRPERRTGQRGQRAVRVPVKRPDRIGPASAPDRLRLRKRIAPRSVCL